MALDFTIITELESNLDHTIPLEPEYKNNENFDNYLE